MQTPNFKNRTMWTADNIDVLRGFNDECIDLIYLDPPFNKNRIFGAAIGSKAAGAKFKDTWTMDDIKNEQVGEISEKCPSLANLINTAGDISGKAYKSYMIVMAVRLLEMKRVLKKTGSIYLHCDSTMSHWLKLSMDAVFGKDNFRNEIIWKRTHAHNDPKRFGRNTDSILFYSKSEEFYFNPVYVPYAEEYVKEFFKKEDERGKYQSVVLTGQKVSGGESNAEWKGYRPSQSGRSWSVPKRIVNSLVGEEKAKTMSIVERLILLDENDYIVISKKGIPRFKQYLHEMPGTPVQTLWTDINLSAQAKQRVGYPTQKPLALLERIIKASSKEGHFILDPFCGCATACIAAELSGRKWVGIDISPKAFDLVNQRMRDEVLGALELGDKSLMGKLINRDEPPTRTDRGKIHDYKTMKHILYGQQEGRCGICQRWFEYRNFEVDHIYPQSKGGNDEIGNRQLLCGGCNKLKSDLPQPEAMVKARELGVVYEGA